MKSKHIILILLSALLLFSSFIFAVELDNFVTFKLKIGSKDVLVNDVLKSLDAPPLIINGRTFVPIRFISENLGGFVDFNSKTQEITLKFENIAKLKETINVLENEKIDLIKTIKDNESKLKEKQNIIDSLNLEIVNLKQKNDELNDQLKFLNLEIENLNQKINSLNEELKNYIKPDYKNLIFYILGKKWNPETKPFLLNGKVMISIEELASVMNIKYKYNPDTGEVFFGEEVKVDSTITYPIVDTMQDKFYDNLKEISDPKSGDSFYGQDAQYAGNLESYTLSEDGLTVLDNVTGLRWQKSPETNGDGTLNRADKLTFENAQKQPAKLNAVSFGGYNDWRLPSIKELYSLIDFRGTDPSGPESNNPKPFINTNYFKFVYGEAPERIIDSQYASSNLYTGKVINSEGGKLFGVNFADGRIKGYGLKMPSGGPGSGGSTDKTFFVICVRGNTNYGKNKFSENQDQTITDNATGLIWTKEDNMKGINWQEALNYVEIKNKEKYLGHNDWRLPNAKELQSIVDYSRCPDTTNSPAIDPVFNCTQIKNEAGQNDYPWYWTNTTHISANGTGGSAIYVCFGRATGYMNGWGDVHGAGAQRSDPKSGDPKEFPQGRGPQGDGIRIYNYVRLVRGG